MKKIVIFLIAIGLFAFVQAQEEGDDPFTSKKGVKILPEAGDVALGINGVPILGYFGNMFNGTANNAAAFNFINADNTIYGKYFLDDATAIRVKFRFGTGTVTDLEYISRDTLPFSAEDKVEDIEKVSTTNLNLSVGYELRRGHGRLQGFYGGEVMFLYNSTNTSYEYGNAFSELVTNPNTTDFGTNVDFTAAGGVESRVLEQNNGPVYGIGVGGFVGVEYFFTPKISFGGEFGYGFAFAKGNDGLLTEEVLDVNNNTILNRETQAGGGKAWNIDTNNAFGAIFLMFHF